jgi:hypothetical protein
MIGTDEEGTLNLLKGVRKELIDPKGSTLGCGRDKMIERLLVRADEAIE